MYKFKLTRITKLTKAQIVVLEGEIVEGYIKTTSTFRNELPNSPLIKVKGIVMGFPPKANAEMVTVTVALNQAGVSDLKIGDILIENE